MERPVRIAQQFAPEKNEIGLALGNDGIGLGGVSNQTNGCGGNGCFATDSGRKLNLKSRSGGDLGVGNLTAGRNIDKIDTALAHELRELNGFID